MRRALICHAIQLVIRPTFVKHMQILRNISSRKYTYSRIVISPQIIHFQFSVPRYFAQHCIYRRCRYHLRIKQIPGDYNCLHVIVRCIDQHSSKCIKYLFSPCPCFFFIQMCCKCRIQMNICAMYYSHNSLTSFFNWHIRHITLLLHKNLLNYYKMQFSRSI